MQTHQLKAFNSWMLPNCLAEIKYFQEIKNPHQSEEGYAPKKQWIRNLLKANEKKHFKLYIVLPSDRAINFLWQNAWPHLPQC